MPSFWPVKFSAPNTEQAGTDHKNRFPAHACKINADFLTSFTAAVLKRLIVLRADPFLSRIQHFELELIHDKGNDHLQDHQHHNKETDEVHSNKPTGMDF